MNRRAALAILCGLALGPRAATAARIWRVGVLDFGSKGHEERLAQQLAKAMAGLGYIEGKSITYDCRYANEDLARVVVLAAEMVRTGPDAIVAPGTAFATALLRETSTSPILTTAADPIGSGFARTLARPGRNVTGLSTASPESILKSIELLKAIIPGQWKLGILEGDRMRFFAGSYEEAARRNGIASVRMSFKDKGEVDRAFASMRSRGIRIVVGVGYPPGYDETTMLALARASGISIIGSEAMVANGAVLSYFAEHADSAGRLAAQLDRILRGTPAGEVPFELPTTMRVTINLATAKALGFTAPADVLLRVDKVYE